MASMMQTIRNWLGPTDEAELLPPALHHPKAKAKSAHATEKTTLQPELTELTESLEDYQSLDIELRLQMGQRIARLLPELAHSKHSLLLDHTARLLKSIAQDQSMRVRAMLAEELATLPEAPPELIRQLAHDKSTQVACPILEYSPLLTDHELLELLSVSPVPGVAEAIARRSHVSESVSDAIVNTAQPGAIGMLLENEGAHIGKKSLATIIEMAPQHEIWHESLAHRPELTQKTVARISGFLSQELLMRLEQNQPIARYTKQDARAAVQHRLTSWTEEQMRQAERKAQSLHRAGRLDDETIDTAIHQPDEPFVTASLVLRTMMTRQKVQKILRSGSASAITALAWEAALPMRSATALQMKIGQVHHTKLLHARGGTDYPLPNEEMQTYLELFS